MGASKKMVRSAFRSLAKKYHPDVNNHADAKTIFLQITEAYDYLYYGKQTRKRFTSPPRNYKPPPPKETPEQRQKRYAKARIKQTAQRKKKEEEAFKSSHFYDIMLAFKYLSRALLLFFTFFLVIFPVHSLIKAVPLQENYHLIFFLILGSIFAYLIYRNWANFLNLGTFNFTFKDFKKLFIARVNTEQACFFTKSKQANGPAYRIRFYRTEEIKTQMGTLLNHKIKIKSTVKRVHVSRNLFAFKVHTIIKLIRFFSVIFAISFLPIESLSWRIFFGVSSSILINQVILRLTKVESDFYFLTNYFLFIRFGIILFILFITTDFSNFAFEHSPILGVWLIMLILLSDIIITPIVVEIPNNKLLRPLGKNKYPKISKLLDEKFQIGYIKSIPSAFYVVFKWFF